MLTFIFGCNTSLLECVVNVPVLFLLRNILGRLLLIVAEGPSRAVAQQKLHRLILHDSEIESGHVVD